MDLICKSPSRIQNYCSWWRPPDLGNGKCIEVDLENVKAFDRFKVYYKQESKIKIRKVTHMVTRRNAFPEFSLQPIIDSFRSNMEEKIIEKNYSLNSILNTDQSIYTYEYVLERNPDFQGSKDVAAAIKSKQKNTHSYIIQITISVTGKLVLPVFLITQEP